ncbi:MAG: hypothetical protein DRJ52_00700 [Thermoprotei archaeon]|nr:MAG: hypothetical protein DRJ52_00700 [Thermoprotei archaeon]
MEKITIVEEEQIPSNAILINCLPDVGLVGAIASSYLVEKLEMNYSGYLDSILFPPIIVLHKDRPLSPVRIYTKGDLVVVLSEIPLPLDALRHLATKIVKWAEEKSVKTVITFGGIPVPNRIDIEKPKVYGIGATEEDREFLRKNNVKLLKEGFMAGYYALLLKERMKKKGSCIALLAESHLQYPDPGAAVSVLEVFSKIYDVKVDLGPLIEQSEEYRIKLKELMKRTLETFRHAQKSYEYTPPLTYV